MDLKIRQHLIDLMIAEGNIDDALIEYAELAEIFYRLAELDKARQTYLDALKVASKSTENRTWGVNLLLKVADIDMQRLNLRQALRIFDQIRTIKPDEPFVRNQLVTINLRLGQDAAAIKELDEYLTFLESTEQVTAGIAFINNLLVDYPERLELRRRLADLYMHNHQVIEAVMELDTVADALLNQGKHLEAINMIETIITLNPSNVKDYQTALAGIRREMLRK
jgi:tetratricopeptide (TPR) repeat protein